MIQFIPFKRGYIIMSTTLISSFTKQDIMNNAMPAIACFTVGMSVAWAVSKAAYWIFDRVDVELAEKTLTRSVNGFALIAGAIASFAASRYLPNLGMALEPMLEKYSWASISLGVLRAAIGPKQPKPDYKEASHPTLSSNISPNCVEEAERNDILPSGGQAVIYGYSHCCYSDLRYGFAKHKNISPLFSKAAYEENLSNKAVGRKCKDYLVQTLLENYRRKTKNNPEEPQIPIIFCFAPVVFK
jgi:hypothetical protein